MPWPATSPQLKPTRDGGGCCSQLSSQKAGAPYAEGTQETEARGLPGAQGQPELRDGTLSQHVGNNS